MLSPDDLSQVFNRVLDSARQEFGGSRSAFDHEIAVGDRDSSAWLGIYNAIYTLARTELQGALTPDGDPTDGSEEAAEVSPDMIRARRLRELLTPHLDALVAGCKGARYTGWSMMHGGPIRRVDELGRNYYPEESPNPPTRPIR